MVFFVIISCLSLALNILRENQKPTKQSLQVSHLCLAECKALQPLEIIH